MRRLNDFVSLLAARPPSNFLFPRRHPTPRSINLCLWLPSDYSVVARSQCSLTAAPARLTHRRSQKSDDTMSPRIHPMPSYPIRFSYAPFDGHITFLLHHSTPLYLHSFRRTFSFFPNIFFLITRRVYSSLIHGPQHRKYLYR
jgi:hypothetical protein